MRLVLLGFLFFAAGCRVDQVAEPDLRRPIEVLPPGARSLVLTSDLQNTWNRFEAHPVGPLLQQFESWTRLLEHPDVVMLRHILEEFEASSGTELEHDLFLNALGRRAGLAFYGEPGGARDDILVAAELGDPDRFQAVLDALREGEQSITAYFEDGVLDGRPVLRFEGENDRKLVIVQDDRLLLVSTRDDLAQDALDLQVGDGKSALQDPELAAALNTVGMHNVVLVQQLGERSKSWCAQGFTWDRKGLHFEHVQATSGRKQVTSAPARRREMMRSLPDGLTLAFYMRSDDLSLQDLLGDLRWSAADDVDVPALRFALSDVLPWVGDEVGIGLRGVEPTAMAPVPELAILLEVRDPQEAEGNLAVLESALGMLPMASSGRRFTDVTYGGRTYRSVTKPLVESLSPSYLLDGDVAIVTTTRELMQQVIDTRRTGKRHLLRDRAFRVFENFVPEDATLALYSNQTRFLHAAQQVGESASLWGQEDMAVGLRELEKAAVLFEHFPAGAAYLVREPERLALRGWMVEKD